VATPAHESPTAATKPPANPLAAPFAPYSFAPTYVIATQAAPPAETPLTIFPSPELKPPAAVAGFLTL